MWWLFGALVVYFAFRGLKDRPRKTSAAPVQLPRPMPVRPFAGVGSGIVPFANPKTRAQTIQDFEERARDYLQREHAARLPPEFSDFLSTFSQEGLNAFPLGGREGRDIEARTETGLMVAMHAEAGMYWTDPDYGHIHLEVVLDK